MVGAIESCAEFGGSGFGGMVLRDGQFWADMGVRGIVDQILARCSLSEERRDFEEWIKLRWLN